MSNKPVHRKRRSLVRFLAAWTPNFLWEYFLPTPTGMYISSSLIQKFSAIRQNNYPSDDSNMSFCSFKYSGKKDGKIYYLQVYASRYCKTVCYQKITKRIKNLYNICWRENFQNRNQQHILYSTPKKLAEVEDNKLKVLQEELHEIKKMVAKLMERQTEQCSGYGTLSNPSDQSQKSFTPPQPPPPPPPLPPQNFTSLNSPLKIEKKKSVTQIAPQPGFPCGKELLRDLKKVQLKKIEKSPGGGPLKKPNKSISEPGDILAAVLKKRFGCVQNSPESSLESVSVDAENSFGSGTINNSFEIDRKMKISVL